HRVLAKGNTHVIDFIGQATARAIRSKTMKSPLKSAEQRSELNSHGCPTMNEHERLALPGIKHVGSEHWFPEPKEPGMRPDGVFCQNTLLRLSVTFNFWSFQQRNHGTLLSNERLGLRRADRDQSQCGALHNELSACEIHSDLLLATHC